MPYKCAVLGCEAYNGKMFKFPRQTANQSRFQKWISASGNPQLLTLPEHKVTRKTVCSKHFEQRYFLQHKLSNSAVPTLFLPEPVSIPPTSKSEDDVSQLRMYKNPGCLKWFCCE